MRRGLLFILLAALLVPSGLDAATITVVNMDGAGEGFNDPTPVAPVGGNPGTTRGQQRLIAFQAAADIWGTTLPSDVEIFVQAFFNPQTCTATSAVLGSAGAFQIFANFPGAEIDLTWYHVALANRLAGGDLAPGPNGTSADDIVPSSTATSTAMRRASAAAVGISGSTTTTVPTSTSSWWFCTSSGHGLGFANFVTEANGTRPLDLGDIFSEYTRDQTTGEKWNDMTNAERQASAINSSRVFWDGINVTSEVPGVLAFGLPGFRVNSPASVANIYAVGTADFGAPISAGAVTGNVVQALDPNEGVGFTTTDGCSAITNAAAVAGNIAIVDRGGCGFVIKAKNVQNAGATAMIVADNAPGAPPAGMTGVDPTVVIPSARITQPSGNLIKAALVTDTVNGTLGVDMSIRAGATVDGFALLNAPNPVSPGSSISHWDPVAFPNQLMEPAINGDLTHQVSGVDLTLAEMTDIGWFSDGDGVPDGTDSCIGSDPGPTVVIDGCDSGAENDTFGDGCRVSDILATCADGASNHGAYTRCVAQTSNALRRLGIITSAEKDTIQSCAGGADIP